LISSQAFRYGQPEPRPKLTIRGKTATAHCPVAEAGEYIYIEQNTKKKGPWTRLAKQGHEIWWEFRKGNAKYTGRLIIDDEQYPVSEAKRRFMK